MPWCPNCKEEFVEGIFACPQCGEGLAESLEAPPPEDGPPPDRPVFLIHAADQALRESVTGLLGEAGIPCYTREPTFAKGVMIYVPAPYYHRACRQLELDADEQLYQEALHREDLAIEAAGPELGPRQHGGGRWRLLAGIAAALAVAGLLFLLFRRGA